MVAIMVSTFMTSFKSVAGAGEINIEHSRNHIAEGFQGIYGVNRMIVDIAEIDPGRLGDKS